MKILVIVNSLAGDGKSLGLLPKFKRWLSVSPHEFLWKISRSPDEMRSEIIRAPARGIQAILLAGGDGTVHEAIPTIEEIALPFGLLPCGRGNDFARNIGISLDLKSNCDIPSNPSIRKIDLPTLNNIPFGSIACVGFDATVNKLARAKKGYFSGTLGYIICVLKALREFKPFEIEIEIDGYIWKGPVMMVAIANGPFYGGGMKIAPNSIMNDGQLDICIVEEVSKWELLREFPKVFSGAHITHPKITLRTGKKIKVISDEYREIFADGEYVGKLPAECCIGNKTIHIMLPHQSSNRENHSGNKKIRFQKKD
jgi:diacylglycerol kinase (ATP)